MLDEVVRESGTDWVPRMLEELAVKVEEIRWQNEEMLELREIERVIRLLEQYYGERWTCQS
jgi:hypothetical protein